MIKCSQGWLENLPLWLRVVDDRTWQLGNLVIELKKLVVVGENGVKRRGPGALVSRPSRFC